MKFDENTKKVSSDKRKGVIEITCVSEKKTVLLTFKGFCKNVVLLNNRMRKEKRC